MKREPHRAIKKEPPAVQPAPRPGPGYDPMDRIVQELQNIQSFLAHLEGQPEDLAYLNKHLPQILGFRRTIAQQLDHLAEEPYDYSASRISALKKENEQIFSYIEGAAGAMNPPNRQELTRFLSALGKTISKFDGDLTP